LTWTSFLQYRLVEVEEEVVSLNGLFDLRVSLKDESGNK
jgi:hypothetical protein